MIEALVAVLVLSLGLLGVAAMQLKALQSSHVSFQRSIATLAAQDAVERLWTELGIHNRKCPDPDNASLNLTHIEDWQDDWSSHLEFRDIELIDFAGADECEYSITVGWGDDRFEGEDVSTLKYRIRLPGM